MTLEKINHSLFKVFVFLLVLTQALIFVTTRAAFDQNDVFEAQFLLANQSFTVGEEIKFQAIINSNQSFNTVYFVLQNIETKTNLQIQAYLEHDNLWWADSSWNTTDYPAGKYELSLIASFYNQTGTLVYTKNSEIVEVNLSPNFQTASVSETEQHKSTEQEAKETDKEIIDSVEAQIISPQKGTDIGQAKQEIVASVSRSLNAAEILGASLYNIDGVLISGVILEAQNSTSTLLYSANLEDASQYPVGEYYFVLWLNEKANYLTDPVVVAVKAQTAEDNQENIEDLSDNFLVTDPVDYKISLIEPKTESFINDQEVNFSFQTNFLAENFGFLLVNENDASIGDEYQISKFDGSTWNKKIDLSSDFVNDKYIVAAIATDPQGVVYEESFSLNLDLATSSAVTIVDKSEIEQEDHAATSSADVVQEKTEDEAVAERLETEDLSWLETPQTVDDVKLEIINATPKTDQDCAARGFTSAEDCAQWLTLENNTLDSMCLAEDIYDEKACEDYLNRTVVDLTCQQAQIFDPQSCRSYLLEKYIADVTCSALDQATCRRALEENYFNRLVVQKIDQKNLADKIEPLIGQSTSLQDLAKIGLESEDLAVDLTQEEEVLFLVSAGQKATVLNQEAKLSSVPGAILLIDSDQDGLSDDLERYFGTDPLNADSDGDGYFDAIEIRNNYNPLGSGQLEKTVTAVAKAILSDLPLEQPKINNLDIDQSWQTEVSSESLNRGVTLSGQAEASSLITIYIYSNVPLVLNTETDKSGHWDYQLKQNLAEGEHQIYVASYDDQGKIIKQSAGDSFFIKKAQAVSAGDYFNDAVQVSSQKSNLIYYLLAIAVMIFIALGVFVYHRATQE